MDNLYNSAKFCKEAYMHKKKLMVHGVARKGIRGIPSSVIQDEVHSKKKQIEVRGTVKVAVLQGDKKLPLLVEACIYDTNSVHFLSIFVYRSQFGFKNAAGLQCRHRNA